MIDNSDGRKSEIIFLFLENFCERAAKIAISFLKMTKLSIF